MRPRSLLDISIFEKLLCSDQLALYPARLNLNWRRILRARWWRKTTWSLPVQARALWAQRSVAPGARIVLDSIFACHLNNAQTELRKGDARVRIISGRSRHTRRNFRSSHAHADRKSARYSDRVGRSARWDLLGNLDEISHR